MSGQLTRMRRPTAISHPSLIAGCVLLALVVAPALVSSVWTPWSPLRLDIVHRLAPPSALHWLGTDPFGRDLLSILMVGARNSLAVGVASIALAAAVGIPAGLAATGRGWASSAVLGATDLGLAFPPLLTAAMVVAVYGAGMGGTILAIGFFNVPALMRLTRAQAAAVLGRDFIAAARIAGRGPAAVLAVHVLPNIAGTLVVQATLALALAALSEAGLSYLGLGVPPPAPSLGRALADYQTRIFDDPLLVVAPGAVIALLVLGFNQLGDGLRDVLDPRIGQSR
jgi:peptide/nickel transport system permease protein